MIQMLCIGQYPYSSRLYDLRKLESFSRKYEISVFFAKFFKKKSRTGYTRLLFYCFVHIDNPDMLWDIF